MPSSFTLSELKYGMYNYSKAGNADKANELLKYFEQNPKKRHLFLLKKKMFLWVMKCGDIVAARRLLNCFRKKCFRDGHDAVEKTALMWSLCWHDIPLFNHLITEFKDNCFLGELDHDGKGILEYAMERNLTYQIKQILEIYRTFQIEISSHTSLKLDKYIYQQQLNLQKIQKFRIDLIEKNLEDES